MSTSKPKVLLEDVNFDFEKGEDVSYDPHIAYTLPSQNGAASGMNQAFILKADELTISEEDMKAIDKLQEEVLKGYNSKRMMLDRVMRAAYPMKGDDYHSGYQYMEDMDDKYVYAMMDDKYYKMPYMMKGNEAVLAEGNPIEVMKEEIYTPIKRQDMTTEDMMSMMMRAMPEFMQTMMMGMMDDSEMKKQMMEQMGMEYIAKASDTPEDNSEVNAGEVVETSDVVKGDEKLDIKEILKSTEIQEVLKGMVDAQVEEKTKEYQEVAKAAQEELEAKKEAEIKKQKEDLTEVVKGWSVVAEEEVEDIVKALFLNEDASIVIKTLEKYEQKIQEVKKEFGEAEHGYDAPATDIKVDEKAKADVAKILKARKTK